MHPISIYGIYPSNKSSANSFIYPIRCQLNMTVQAEMVFIYRYGSVQLLGKLYTLYLLRKKIAKIHKHEWLDSETNILHNLQFLIFSFKKSHDFRQLQKDFQNFYFILRFQWKDLKISTAYGPTRGLPSIFIIFSIKCIRKHKP